jgi:integrase
MENVRPKRNGYEARIQLPGQPRLSAYGSTEQDALNNLEQKVLRLERPPDFRTFHSYMETAYKPTLEHKSKYSREQLQSLMHHFKPIADLPLVDVDRSTLQSLVNRKLRQGYSWWTVKHIIKFIHAILNLAEADGLIPSNPARHVKMPGKPKSEQRVLSPLELRRLIETSSRRGSSAIVPLVLGGCMGLGFDEMRGLTPVDFRGEWLYVAGTKTEYRPRTLYLPRPLLDLIAGRKFPLVGSSTSSIHKAISLVSTSLEIESFGRNVLRHTCMTGLQSVGCPLEVRGMIAGHSPRGMTAHYSHDGMKEPIKEYLGRWADKVLHANGELRGEQEGKKCL